MQQVVTTAAVPSGCGIGPFNYYYYYYYVAALFRIANSPPRPPPLSAQPPEPQQQVHRARRLAGVVLHHTSVLTSDGVTVECDCPRAAGPAPPGPRRVGP